MSDFEDQIARYMANEYGLIVPKRKIQNLIHNDPLYYKLFLFIMANFKSKKKAEPIKKILDLDNKQCQLLNLNDKINDLKNEIKKKNEILDKKVQEISKYEIIKQGNEFKTLLLNSLSLYLKKVTKLSKENWDIIQQKKEIENTIDNFDISLKIELPDQINDVCDISNSECEILEQFIEHKIEYINNLFYDMIKNDSNRNYIFEFENLFIKNVKEHNCYSINEINKDDIKDKKNKLLQNVENLNEKYKKERNEIFAQVEKIKEIINQLNMISINKQTL